MLQMKFKPTYLTEKDVPSYQNPGDSGMDVKADLERSMHLNPLERAAVPTGVFMALPLGRECQVRPRSGLALNKGLTVLNSPGTVDSSYRGEVKVILVNVSETTVTINPGDRIAQFVFADVKQEEVKLVDELDSTVRGSGGFGSTGF